MMRFQEQFLHLRQTQQASQCPSETEQLSLPSLIRSLLRSNPTFVKQVNIIMTHILLMRNKNRGTNSLLGSHNQPGQKSRTEYRILATSSPPILQENIGLNLHAKDKSWVHYLHMCRKGKENLIPPVQ